MGQLEKIVAKIRRKQPGDPISTIILPTELIDYIMDILRDDLPALQACSLTCRVMLASARRLIHQTLYLTPENYNYQSVPTRRYRLRFLKRNHNYFELRFLSYVGERGLLQYTRQIHISMSLTFSPDAILPHLHHFQSLNHVHTLTLEEFNLLRWTSHYQTCFSHFYPTLTSLTLRRCVDYDRLLLRFVLQFPRLENLCIERLWELVNLEVAPPNPTVTVDQPPPLCGHLRLTGGDTLSQLTTYFSREGVNFRSVELEKFPGSRAQPILNACGHTLEYLTIIHNGDGMHQLLFLSMGIARLAPNFLLAGEWELTDLSFTGLTTLRRLTLCFPRVFDVFKFKRHFRPSNRHSSASSCLRCSDL